MMETAENKNFKKKNELPIKRLFQFNDKPVECTNVHWQCVDRSESRNPIFLFFFKGGGGSINTACNFIYICIYILKLAYFDST
jgi:hypothetical protein